MIEYRDLNSIAQWWHPGSSIVPSLNLTPSERKKLKEREAIIDRFKQGGDAWIRINNGIYKGSIVPAVENRPSRYADAPASYYVNVCDDYPKQVDQPTRHINDQIRYGNLDRSKGWEIPRRNISVSMFLGTQPIMFSEATIYPQFFNTDVSRSTSLLFDYEGDRVFKINESKRPLTFEDRLGQEVSIGDLVVVALNYGAGLDVCVVKGFADERRVTIQSVESGDMDRIPLEDNATRKIMKMPNSLKDTALMMKLAR